MEGMEPINPRQLALLRAISARPGRPANQLPAGSEADLIWLTRNDLVQERGTGGIHPTHLGSMVLKRAL